MQFLKQFSTSFMITGVLMLTVAGKAHAYFSLDFEGIGDNTPVSDYYESSYGITFTDNAVALVEFKAGGNGNFAFEPSPYTAVLLYGKPPLRPTDFLSFTMNVKGGFTDNLTFYYSAPFLDYFSPDVVTVSIYSGLNGSGNLLGQWPLDQTPERLDPQGKPIGGADFNVFVPVVLTLPTEDTAKSVVFYGPYAQFFIDNIRNVPTPGTILLMGIGLGGLVSFRKRIVTVKY